jgi:hypothetical protein
LGVVDLAGLSGLGLFFALLRTQQSTWQRLEKFAALLCRLITFNRVSYRIQPLEAEKQGLQLYAFRGRTPVGGRNLVLGLLKGPLGDEGLHCV